MRKLSVRKSLVTVLGVAAIAMCAGPTAALADSTTGSSTTGDVAGFGPGASTGQTFTVPAGPDTFFHSLTINGFNSFSGTSHIKVATVDGGGLPTTVLFTSPTIPATAGPVPLTVYPNITVTAGTQYAFYIEPDTLSGGVSPADSTTDVYAGGTVVTRPNPPGTTWAANSAHDIAFLASFNTGKTDTLTTISCPGPGKIGQTIACTATVKDANSGTGQSGLAVAPSNLNGGSFPGPACVTNGSGDCTVNFTPTNSGGDTIFAQFLGDATHIGSSGSTALTVNKRTSGQTAAGCSPTTLHVGETTTCFVTVSDTDTGTKTSPSGAATWSSTGGGTFAGGGACGLTPQSLGVSKCVAITYTPTAPGAHSITSAYAGDATHLASSSAAAGSLTVLPAPAVAPDCSAILAKISSTKKKLHKASGAKKKKLKKKLKSLRGQAALLGC